ncbi:hypothetical protein [Bacillus sp. OV166]|uniref:hypothetical protein n=1 Tax=Bacillus sp. OV166 TaxID=1882763 RepID=UPI000B43A695|nr:hypothetical protein [Bacillus sp. OV166]
MVIRKGEEITLIDQEIDEQKAVGVLGELVWRDTRVLYERKIIYLSINFFMIGKQVILIK